MMFIPHINSLSENPAIYIERNNNSFHYRYLRRYNKEQALVLSVFASEGINVFPTLHARGTLLGRPIFVIFPDIFVLFDEIGCLAPCLLRFFDFSLAFLFHEQSCLLFLRHFTGGASASDSATTAPAISCRGNKSIISLRRLLLFRKGSCRRSFLFRHENLNGIVQFRQRRFHFRYRYVLRRIDSQVFLPVTFDHHGETQCLHIIQSRRTRPYLRLDLWVR
mmetsp:Transcript_27760/g.58648  ORF Transcript_27760/g.58648 Transcript_27760/m.58648 type:complete len:221 (-) Transcript_27760:310-972(-)